MELNGDGNIDILSGSYSRHDKDMAGLFQVLWGNKDGTFRAPEGLKGSDGELLILTTTEGAGTDTMVQKICTRPTAVDLDGDGKLDLVSGNFGGTFAFFRGEDGGKFAPKSTWLQAGGKEMHVPHHSDPCFVDWDKDGDLDLLSGSSSGGVFLFENQGSKTAPKFAASVALLSATDHTEESTEPRFGDAHLTGPKGSTRVFVADVNGDGKLDLLVGDQVTLTHLATGVTEADAKAKFKVWQAKRQAFLSLPMPENATKEQQQKWQTDYQALDEERDKFAREEMTGFVWLLLQK